MAILDEEHFPKHLPKIPPDGKHCNGRLWKTRAYCKRHPLVGGNGRCKTHGGKNKVFGSLGAELTMGDRSHYLPPELKARYESLTGDAVEGLEQNVKMQQGMETMLWSQLETGESHQAWQLLNELAVEYEYGNDETRKATFTRIKQVVQGGLKAYGVKREILDLHERQRRQTESLVKARKEIQETWTLEQDRERMSILLRILKMRVDNATLRQIAGDIEAAKLLSVGVYQEATNGNRMVAVDIGRIGDKSLESVNASDVAQSK